MKTLRKRIFYAGGVALVAYSYFIMTEMIFWDIVHENILAATIWNFALTIGLLAFDRVEKNLYMRIDRKIKEGNAALWLKAPKVMFYNFSFKSALYLFYVGVLICVAILAADPNFPHLSHMHGYFQSVYYGVLVLFAADKLFEQLFKDADNDGMDDNDMNG